MLRAPGAAAMLVLRILAAPSSSLEAQPSTRIPRVGVLTVTSSSNIEAFKRGLRELGWIEGQSVAFEQRYYGTLDRLPEMARELVALRVDAIFAPATAPTKAARQATGTIPIVFAGVADPVGAGFAAGLARPGGNVTGLSAVNLELSAKRLDLLKEAAPGVMRVGMLVDPKDPIGAPWLRATEPAARALGIRLQPLEVIDPLKKVGYSSDCERYPNPIRSRSVQNAGPGSCGGHGHRASRGHGAAAEDQDDRDA